MDGIAIIMSLRKCILLDLYGIGSAKKAKKNGNMMEDVNYNLVF